MVGLVLGAVALDCTRMAADARHRVDLADGELRKHEERLSKLLAGSAERWPEVSSAIGEYQAAKELTARHAAYEKLVTDWRRTTSTSVDPTNPLDRKFMDDIAGAINRREIAEKAFDAEWALYQEFLNSARGGVARWFSPRATADWEAGKPAARPSGT
jgi:hypothetical protein